MPAIDSKEYGPIANKVLIDLHKFVTGEECPPEYAMGMTFEAVAKLKSRALRAEKLLQTHG